MIIYKKLYKLQNYFWSDKLTLIFFCSHLLTDYSLKMTEITIPEFFKNQSVFITGGSGFIGKVLIEKLLRSCPDLKNIYLLMREKKGKSPQERIESIINYPVSIFKYRYILSYTITFLCYYVFLFNELITN